MDDDIKFSEDLIKGKIAETIFEQMFRSCGRFNILQFGYEHTLPEIAQHQHIAEVQAVLKNIRNAPDFILVTSDQKAVYLVEVKYRYRREPKQIKKIAEDMLRTWDPSWLFIASPDGFFFEPCAAIVENEGNIVPLPASWIASSVQQEYLELLNEFEKNSLKT